MLLIQFSNSQALYPHYNVSIVSFYNCLKCHQNQEMAAMVRIFLSGHFSVASLCPLDTHSYFLLTFALHVLI